MKTSNVTKALKLCFALFLQIIAFQAITAQTNPSDFQLIPNGDFENSTTQNINSISDFNIYGDNTPELFVGSTNISTGTNAPNSRCGVITPQGWDAEPTNHYLMLRSDQSVPQPATKTGVSFNLKYPTQSNSMVLFSIQMLSKCNRKLHIVFSVNPPCTKTLGPDNVDSTWTNGFLGGLTSTNCNYANPFTIGFDTVLTMNGSSNWQRLDFAKKLNNAYKYVTIYSEGNPHQGPVLILPDVFFIDEVELIALDQLRAVPVADCNEKIPDPCNLVCNGDMNMNNATFMKYTDFFAVGTDEATADLCTTSNRNYFNFDFYHPGTIKNSTLVTSSLFCKTPGTDIRIDYPHDTDNNKKFLHLFSSNIPNNNYGEGIYFPLKGKVREDSTYTLSFDYLKGCNHNVYFAFSKTKPCPQEFPIRPLYQAGQAITAANFNTACSGGVEPFLFSPTGLIANPAALQWQFYSKDITMPQDAEYLIVFVDRATTDNQYSLYLDNIKLIEKPIDPKITAKVLENCPDGKVKIEYTITVFKPLPEYIISLTPQLPLPAGLTIAPNGVFPTSGADVTFNFPTNGIAPDSVKYTLVLNADTTTFGKMFTVNMKMKWSSPCMTPTMKMKIIPVTFKMHNATTKFNHSIVNCPQLILTAITDTAKYHRWEIVGNGQTIKDTGKVLIKYLPNGTYQVTHYIDSLKCPILPTTKTIVINCTACNCVTGYTIGTSNLSSSAIYQLNSTNFAGCLSITGALIIDKDYTFDATLFKMETNARILVKSNVRLTITKSLLESCSNMWKGIELEENATLDFRQNTIRDAIHAIGTPFGASRVRIAIRNNRFERNWIGINLDSQNSGGLAQPLNGVPIKNNVFTCENMQLKIPYAGQKTLVAMEFTNYNISGLGISQNYVNTASNGIRIFGGQINLHATELKNINTYGIEASKSAVLKNLVCKFDNVGICVKSEDRASIYTAFMNITNSYQGFDIKNALEFELINFNMEVEHGGIILAGGLSSTIDQPYIKEGTIRFINKTPFPTWLQPSHLYGLRLTNIDASNAPGYFMIENIKINSNLVKDYHDMKVDYSKHIKIIDNTVTSNLENGVWISSSEDIKLKNNVITKHPSDKICLLFSNLQNSTICCTTVDGGHYGIQADNTNTELSLKNNIIKSHQEVGFVVRQQASILSIQENGGNRWEGKSPLQAQHDGGNDPQYKPYVQDSRFIIGEAYNPSVADPYWAKYTAASPTITIPKLQNVGQAGANDWFSFEPRTTNDCDTEPLCNEPIFKTVHSREIEQRNVTTHDTMVALGAFKEAAHGRMMTVRLNALLFKKLSENSYLYESNELMKNFYNEVKGTSIELFYTIDALMVTANELREEDRNTLIQITQERKELVERLKSYYESLENTEDEMAKNEFIKLISSLNERLSDIGILYASVLDKIKQNKIEKIKVLLAMNNAIKATERWELNQQTINEIYANTVLSGRLEFTDAEKEKVRSIAFQCIFEGGWAVQMAQSLYQYWEAYRFEYGDFCTTVPDGKVIKSNLNTTLSAENIVMIAPNPASDLLNISVSTPDKNTPVQCEIVSLTGQIAKNLTLNQDNNSINIENIEAGFYICKIYQGKNLINSQKVLIVKK